MAKQSDIDQLKRDLDTAQRRNGDLVQERDAANQRNEVQAGLIRERDAALREKEEMISALRGQNRSLEGEIETLRSMVKGAQADLEIRGDLLTDYETTIDVLSQLNSSRVSKLRTMRRREAKRAQKRNPFAGLVGIELDLDGTGDIPLPDDMPENVKEAIRGIASALRDRMRQARKERSNGQKPEAASRQ